MTPRTVAFYTLGCKLNYTETSSIERLFTDKGYQAIDFEQGADIYIINTCSVTEFADRKCRQIVRRSLGLNPAAFVVVTGCYAQLKPQEISDIPGVDLVLGAAEKFRILDYIDDLTKSADKGMVKAGDVREANGFHNAFSFGDRTRSFLKVQDGCDYKCSFCTIPLARGASRSDTVENVIANIHKIEAMGVQEIVLTGVNLGDFGNGTEVIEGMKPKKEALFVDLIEAIETQTSMPRFRISSIEPNLLTPQIISFVARSNRFLPHFHIPLQSGNNKQLSEMRRRYKRELYTERVNYIREQIPHACIGVDVIVGFPNETDADFEETYRFIQELDVSYLHVFTYSERANTLANEMPNAVPMNIRRERNERLRLLSEKKRHYFYNQHRNTVRKVLWEASEENGKMHGFTDNYIRVSSPYNQAVINQITDALLQDFDENGDMSALIL